MGMEKVSLPNDTQMPLPELIASQEDSSPRVSFLARLAPKVVREARDTFKQSGVRGVTRKYGWKIFAAFFAYYLIRDSVIYLLVPYLIARGLM
jgi:hypothetical protein